MLRGSFAIAERKLWRAVLLTTAMIAPGVFGVNSVSAQCQYSVTVVEGVPCGSFGVSVHFLGINDLGQACGRRSICNEVGQWLPIVWTEELGLITLPLPEGATRGEANDINNVLGSDGVGQVACTLRGGTLGGDRAFLYDDGEWTVLAPTGDGNSSSADGVNDKSWVVGYRDTDTTLMAYRWRDNVVEELASVMRDESARAKDINQFEDAIGRFGALINGRAFLWQDSQVTLIPPVNGGTSSDGQAMNNYAVVTGQSFIDVKSGSVPRRSWRYQNGMLTDLGGFADTHRNIAEDINDAGQIVGSCFSAAGGSGETSYLWQDGELIKLDDFILQAPGFFGLAAVTAINNRGQIAGYGGGTAEGIILTPIDVPLGDVDLDCEVDGWDLALLLGAWGVCDTGNSCLADMVSSETFQPPPDGVVDGADLAIVLGNWTVHSSSQSGRN